MDKIDFKFSAIAVTIISLMALIFDPLLALSLILGFLGFSGYYVFLQKRIDSLLKNQNKFVFYLSIVASIAMMTLPFIVMTLISPTGPHYVGCALGFIIFKIIMNIKGILNR